MRGKARFWFTLSLGSFLLVSPRPLVGQAPACDPKELNESLPTSVGAYPDAVALSEFLNKHGISVTCVPGSTMDGTFEDQKGAAAYRTDHGDFEVLFLPQPKTFDQLKVIERQKRPGLHISL